MVWVTITTAGQVVTTQTTYQQLFKSTFTTADTETVKSGAIGLGSISGRVGEVRSYERKTESANEGIAAASSGLLVGLAVVLGMVA